MMKPVMVVASTVLALLASFVPMSSANAADPVCTINITESNIEVQGTNLGDVICITGDYNTVYSLGGDDTVIDEGIDNTIFLAEGFDSYYGSGGSGSTVDGGPGDDELIGTPGPDEITGGDGDDTLIGAEGDDTLNGGLGADELAGNAGDDEIFGESGTDVLAGETGNDLLVGGAEIDVIEGGTGLNYCDFQNGEISTTSCIYDTQVPVVSLSFGEQQVDSGFGDTVFNFTVSGSDDVGVSHLYLDCYGSTAGTNYGASAYINHDFSYLKQNFGEYDYNGTRITSLEGDAKSFVITGYGKVRSGAVPGPNITCQLQAFDSIGNRSSANVPQGPQIWRTPPGLPSAPRDLNFEMDSRSSGVLSWLDPLNAGSPSFTHYVLQTSTDGTTWSTPMKRSLEAKSVSVDRLVANTDYWFRLRGENAGTVGQDTTYMNLNWSTIKFRTPAPVVPDSPTALLVSNVTSSGYKLVWSAPSSNGGAAITDFKVEVSSDGGNTWRLAKQAASTSLTLNVSGAAPGTNYLVRVGAINSVGISDYLTGSLKTASTVPRTPRDVSSSNVSGTSLSLSWLLPSSNGGSAITDYKVEVSSNCSTYTVINRPVSVNLGFNVTGLKPGTKYCFRVSAGNSIGYSSPTQVFEVSTQGYPPAAPTSLSVKVSKTSVTLGWKAATVNGGSAVKNYIVEYSKNYGYTWLKVTKPVSTSRTLTVKGLRNRTIYLFRVIAVNDVGNSQRSKTLKVVTG
jgi:hypothetical protein